MERILISACLVGDKVRYDAKGNYNPLVEKLLEKFELVPFCPEVEGGLKIPRIPSERLNEKVINKEGKDVTKFFKEGANKALRLCLYLGITKVVLKERSPSCGVHSIYNGKFENKLIQGKGYTAELLSQNGITVYCEDEIEKLIAESK